MTTKSPRLPVLRTIPFALCLAIGVAAVLSCSRPATPPPAETRRPAPEAGLAPYRVELLDLAFAAASSLPLDPHIKSRARAQEAVAAVCLELGSPARALSYAEVIPNWRRGAVCADVAEHYARAGRVDAAREMVAAAERVLESGLAANDLQEWRRDRVRAKAARVRLLLGDESAAAALLTGAAPVEAARIEPVRAELLAETELAARVKELSAVFATGELDVVQHAVDAVFVLLRRFGSGPQGPALEALLDTGLAKSPLLVQFDVLLRRAGAAASAGKPERALALADRAAELVPTLDGLPEHRIPRLARIAAIRRQAGDAARAAKEFAAVLSTYEAEERRIAGFDRAEALVPVAEAARALGDDAQALSIYRRALDEGTRNPNGRPRAEDLVAICLSLASAGLEPDPELRARLLAARDGLGAPW